MYYFGYFRSTDTTLDNMGQLYKVVIVTNYQDGDFTNGGELTLCDTPFVVEYEGKENNVYKPYKCSTATVRFLLEDYNFQFNNTSGNNVLVSLLKYKGEGDIENDANYTTEWVGFATPNAYNQGYEYQIEEFELECQDAFSTLKYYDFEKIGYNPVIDNKYLSFSDILKYWINFLGIYRHIYVTDSVKVPTGDFQDIFHACYINEDNFFDEDGEPMKAIEVIEELLKYLGLTLIPWRDSIYIINYNALITGYNDYFVYEGDNLILNSKKEHIEHFKDITGDDFSEDGQTISVDNVYKKVTVKDDFYPVKDFITNLSEYDDWQETQLYDNIGTGSIIRIVKDVAGTITGEKTIYINTIDIKRADENITQINTTIYNKQILFIKYFGYNGSDFLTHWYDWRYFYNAAGDEINLPDTLTPNFDINANKQWNWHTTYEHEGTCFIKYQLSNVDDFSESINSIKLNDAILFTNGFYGEYNRETRDTPAYKGILPQSFLTVWTKNAAVSNDNYLVISGKFKFFHYGEILPVNEEYNDSKKMDSGLSFVWARLKTNDDLYWNGSAWVQEPVMFKLPLKYEKAKKAFGEDIEICNNIVWSMNLDKEGYAIPMPQRELPQEVRLYDFQLDFMKIFGVCKDRITKSALLTDFNMEIGTKSYKNTISSSDDSDTEYSNEVNSKAVEEYEDIELKVTTWDGKEINHSSVFFNEAFLENGNDIYGTYQEGVRFPLRRLETLYNMGNGMLLRPEELKVYDVYNQYKAPTLIFNVNLRNDITPYSVLTYKLFDGKLFIVDDIEIDYQYNKSTLKLVEKK